MKISYMLWNRTGKGRKVPGGQAWQWIHEIEDEHQMESVLQRLKKTIRDCRLTLINMQIEQHRCPSEMLERASFAYKGPIFYDENIPPKRIFHVHEETFEEHDTARS